MCAKSTRSIHRCIGLSLYRFSQRSLLKPPHRPLIHRVRTHALIKLVRGGIPVKHHPVHAVTAAIDGGGGDALEQGFAETNAASVGANVQVFEIDSFAANPRAVIVEEEREAFDNAVHFAHDGFADGPACRREQIFVEILRCRDDFIERLFILGKFADERENRRDVGRGRWAY